MKKVAPLIALIAAVSSCIAVVLLCRFYDKSYKRTVSELESRIIALDRRVAAFEGHGARILTPVHVWAVISTSDRPLNVPLQSFNPPKKFPEDIFETVNSKGGPWIRPELRLTTGAATETVFDLNIASDLGIVVGAWFSHAQPYADLAAFERFNIYSTNQDNIVRVTALPKSGASVQMHFEIVLLCLR